MRDATDSDHVHTLLDPHRLLPPLEPALDFFADA